MKPSVFGGMQLLLNKVHCQVSNIYHKLESGIPSIIKESITLIHLAHHGNQGTAPPDMPSGLGEGFNSN